MGSACAKASTVDSKPQGSNENQASEASSGIGRSTDEEKIKTFRERRLSMSQTADPKLVRRRLSVYGGGEEDDLIQPSVVQPPMPTCGCKTIAGLEPIPGGSVAKINQDRGLAIYPFNGDDQVGLFGVYDGHGRLGEKVSEYVIQNLPAALLEDDELETNPGRALIESYLSVDGTLAEYMDAGVSGTTAVTALMKDRHIWFANAGDSRAVIARSDGTTKGLKAHDTTIDQKPDSPGEIKRIMQMGGHVTPAGANGSPSRVWHNLRGLAMARSIGDHHAATVGVIAEPEITEYDIQDDDVALIIASDGVWELLSSQKVVDIVASVKSRDPNEMCALIVEQASYMWKVEEGDYRDDITVVIILFPWLNKNESKIGEV